MYLLCKIKARIRWCTCRVENILTLGKLLSLWFCFLLHSILFLISQTSYRTYKIISSNELARPVMGTIFLVTVDYVHNRNPPPHSLHMLSQHSTPLPAHAQSALDPTTCTCSVSTPPPQPAHAQSALHPHSLHMLSQHSTPTCSVSTPPHHLYGAPSWTK